MLKMNLIHNVDSMIRTAKAAWQGFVMPYHLCAAKRIAVVGCEGGFRL
jgi:hypothetical protein